MRYVKEEYTSMKCVKCFRPIKVKIVTIREGDRLISVRIDAPICDICKLKELIRNKKEITA